MASLRVVICVSFALLIVGCAIEPNPSPMDDEGAFNEPPNAPASDGDPAGIPGTDEQADGSDQNSESGGSDGDDGELQPVPDVVDPVADSEDDSDIDEATVDTVSDAQSPPEAD